jgi:hypothetical protein
MFELEVIGRPEDKRLVPVQQLLDAIAANRGAIRIRHAIIDEPIDFASQTFSHKLIIQDTIFKQPVQAVDGHFRKSVDLSGCEFRQGLDATGCAVDGTLTLNDVIIHEGQRSPDQQHENPFAPPPSFRLLRVQGNVHARNVKSQHALNFSDARIAGDLDLSGAEIVGGVVVETAVIGGSLAANRVRLPRRWPEQPPGNDATKSPDENLQLTQDGGAWLSGMRVSGGVSFSGADIAQGLALLGVSIKIGLFCGPDGNRTTTIGGDVLLDAAQVGHVVDFTRCHVKGSLRMVGGVVEGSLVCDGGTIGIHRDRDPEKPVQGEESSGNAVLVGVRVSGHASFNGAFIEHELNLQSAEIKGGLFCRPQGDRPTWIGGNAHLSSVKVAVEVGLSGVRIDGELVLSNAVVDGSLMCNRPPAEMVSGGQVPRPQIQGTVSLDGIRVQGQVNFQGAALEKGINLQNATIQSGLACQPAEGQITEICRTGEGLSLVGAHVSGGINLAQAQIGGTINLEDAVIEGDLTCQETDVAGEILLGGAKITDAVKANRARVKSHLNMQGTVVQGTLSCFPIEVGGSVDMRSAWIHDADLDFRRFGTNDLPDLQLDRCQFQELPWFPDLSSQPAPRGEKASPGQRDYLLRLLDAANHPFCKSNYLLMEKLLRNSGEEEWADDVSRSRRAEDRKQKSTPLRFAEWLLLDLATGYGTRTHRLFWVFVALVALTTVFFLPRDAVVLTDSQGKPDEGKPQKSWTWTDALLLSLRVNLPMVNLIAGGDSKPSSEPVKLFGRPLQLGAGGLAITCEGWATFVSLLSYIVVPLFAAGVLGFIKKQQ